MGNPVIVGTFQGDLPPLTQHGNFDLFAIKLDSAGNPMWGKSVGGQGNDEGNAVAVDSLGTLASSGSTVVGNVSATVTTTPVPEPASYAMMLAGFGAMAFVAKRRRR